MITRIYLLIILVLVVGCKTNAGDNGESISEDEEVKNYVSNFYTWYIFNIYKSYKSKYFLPNYVKRGESKYIFDTQIMIKKLRNTGYFSENFIKRDSMRVSLCNAEMLKIDWEYEPEPEFNISLCNFLWKDRIVGGQGEDLDSFECKDVRKLANGFYLVIVDLYEKRQKSYSAKVHIKVLGDQKFQIEEIELEWVRYKR